GRLGLRHVLLEPALRLQQAVRLRLLLGRERFARHRQVDSARVLGRRLTDAGDDGPAAVAQALGDDGDLTALPRGWDLLAVDHGAPPPTPRGVQRRGQRAERVAAPLSFQQVRNPPYRL